MASSKLDLEGVRMSIGRLLRNSRTTDRHPRCPIASFWPVWRRGIAACSLLRNSRTTDRDPLCPIASFWPVWRRGISACALLTYRIDYYAWHSALARTRPARTRRQVFVQADANFLQFAVPIT